MNISASVVEKHALGTDWASFEAAPLVEGTGQWDGNIYTPSKFRLVYRRRAIVCIWGEVFWQSSYSEKCDVVISRARFRLPHHARLIHYTQYAEYASEFVALPAATARKSCAFMTGYVRKFSGAESAARWALFALAAKRYGCEFIGKPEVLARTGLTGITGKHCTMSPKRWPLCFRNYKVGIVGENSLLEGYVSEKLSLPQLVGAKPLYVGASDVRRYSNDLVECKVSNASLTALRKLAQEQKWYVKITEAELVAFAVVLLAIDFKPCLDEIGKYM